MIDLMVMKTLTMWLIVSCFAFLVFLMEKLQKGWLVAALIINAVLTILMMFFWALFHDNIMGLLT